MNHNDVQFNATTSSTSVHPVFLPEAIDTQANMSENTRRAYYADLQAFLMQGGVLPTPIEALIPYLEQCAGTLNPRTLQRRLSMIRKWHQLRRLPDPTGDPVVRDTLKGIARTYGQPKVKASALRLPALLQLLTYLKEHPSLKHTRNQALLLMGYFGAFRRAELVNLRWESMEWAPEGLLIQLDRSKTDQIGEGLTCAIPVGPDAYCPVRALMQWREASGHYQGAIFRRITHTGTILSAPISAHYWNTSLKQLAHLAQLPNANQISSHSLRRGSTTEAARQGAPLVILKRHGRWRSAASVLEYIEEGRRFKDSAAQFLFEF